MSSDLILQDGALAGALPMGVRILSLKDYLSDAEASVQESFKDDASGVVVRIDESQKLASPLKISFLQSSGDPSQLVVLAGKHSEAIVLEDFLSADGVSLSRQVKTHFILEEGSRITHARLQNEGDQATHEGHLFGKIGRNASFESAALHLGGVRSSLTSVMDLDEGAQVLTRSVVLSYGDQNVSCDAKVNHLQPHATSRMIFKGVLEGKSTVRAEGYVLVSPGAQKTDATQSLKCLLLSPEATALPEPKLEIYADDVKCAHGATVGSLDDNALFYLQSRGLDPEQARDMLVKAFVSEAFEGMGHIGEELEQACGRYFERGISS